MTIAVDAMGGDHAPETPVRGAIAALREAGSDLEILLVGDESRVRPLIGRGFGSGLRLVHAPQVVGMDEPPVAAVRSKRESSIRVGLELQKSGKAHAFVSAGNTGAVMAAALATLGRVETISRPAIVTVWPTRREPCLVLDVGANVDARPRHLLQFGLMGHLYAREILGRERPKVGLLSIGEEPTKGNELTVAAHALLAGSRLEFVGNVEGRDVLEGSVDVVVCDGFVGNILLKFGESMIDFFTDAIREAVDRSLRSRMGAALMEPAFASLERRLDYAEHGGAPLLGIDGVVIIGHGGSSVKAMGNAIRVAKVASERALHRSIERAVREEAGSGTPAGADETPTGVGAGKSGGAG
ncbi:MAG: phosphate acyltransferase PlsX [Gemmatimonadetes bacterium]|nr:phosphate acyltransferase PlsX [Gemmatimonadota bacterium]